MRVLGGFLDSFQHFRDTEIFRHDLGFAPVQIGNRHNLEARFLVGRQMRIPDNSSCTDRNDRQRISRTRRLDT